MVNDKVSTATVEASKVKEENSEVAGVKCWKGFGLSVLTTTGEIFTFSAKTEIFLRDLDLAYCRPFCYSGLHSLRHCLLQL